MSERSVGWVGAAALLAAMVPALPAHAAPKIAFVNPSGYSTTMRLSDKQDVNTTAHLVAWVQDVPSNPLVEFEVEPVAAGSATTIDAEQAGNDTWEASLSLGGLIDGNQYIVRARLFSGFVGPGTGTEVAMDENIVTVEKSDLPPPAPNTVEITYPDNGGPLGVFHRTGGRANALIDGVASEDTDQVRVLYTRTSPGSDPSWDACGSGRVNSADGTFRARCTLEEGVQGSQVRAVAAVANDTPVPADPSPAADATGDAHRVLPYAQEPSTVFISPEATEANPNTCRFFTLSVLDQSLRPIANANVDIHATGPDDQLQFGVLTFMQDPTADETTSGFQPPDSGHVSQRAAVSCTDGTNSDSQRQGDHNIPRLRRSSAHRELGRYQQRRDVYLRAPLAHARRDPDRGLGRQER